MIFNFQNLIFTVSPKRKILKIIFSNCFTKNFIQHFQNLQNEKLYFTRDAINNSLFKISNFTVSRKKNLRRTLPKSCSIASIKKKRYKHHQKRFSKILIPARLVDIPSYFQKSNLCWEKNLTKHLDKILFDRFLKISFPFLFAESATLPTSGVSATLAEVRDEPRTESAFRRLSEVDRILLESLDIGRSRPRPTGRFLTMHKRRRKRLTTRSLTEEPGILDDIFHGLVQVSYWSYRI